MTRYVIIGTGAVGGVIGGNLARFGVPTVWVARGEHGRILASEGLTLHTADGTYHPRAEVWSGPQDATLTPDDVLLLCVKTQSAQRALAEWADVPVGDSTAGESLPMLVCTNGVEGERIALRYFRNVYGVAVWCPATFVTPGVVASRLSPANAGLHISRVPAGPRDGVLDACERDFTASNLEVTLPDDVMAWKRRKLVTNMMNIVEALVGPSDDAESKRRIVQAMRAEAREVFAASGLPITSDADESAAREAGSQVAQPVAGYDPDAMGSSSTWQSLSKGQELETDYLNGEIVALAHELGMDAPVNAAAARLGRVAAREQWHPGHFTAAELADALGV